MASKNVSAPPAPKPTPVPTPTPAIDETSNGDVMGVVTGEGMPEGNAARDETAPTGKGDPDTVQPIKDSENEDAPVGNGIEQDPAIAEEAFATLTTEPFDPSTNLGDWDGDGKAGGSAPVQKHASEKTNAELGAGIGKSHAEQMHEREDAAKPSRDQIKKIVDEEADGKLPNGKPLDDEFWTSYDQAYEREAQQLIADGLSDEDRLRRVEKTLGLLSPRA